MFSLEDRENPQLRGDLRNRLSYLRDRVREVWDGPTALPHFTRHGTDHCARIEAHLANLVPLLRSPLNLTETYILSSAVWTHDIGMQDARFSLGNKAITEFTAQDYLTIRDSHAAASEAWILDVFNETRQKRDLGLRPDDYTLPIARVARAHTRVELEDVNKEQYVYGQRVRLRLLAALLIVADELDLDGRRVNLDLLLQINISGDSKVHWWCHHYIDGVSINGHTPHIHMTLPQSYEGLVAEEWKARATAGLRKQLSKRALRQALEEEGCWLALPEVIATFDASGSKRLWPREIPLDTRTAVQEADIRLLQGFEGKDLTTFMAASVYGASLDAMEDEERDRFHAGVLKLTHGWAYMGNAQLTCLIRQAKEKIHPLLLSSTLSPFTRLYWYTWSILSLLGRFEAQAVPSFGRPRVIPTELTEDYCWNRLREDLKMLDAQYYEARGRATTEATTHKVEIDQIKRIVDEIGARIKMVAVICTEGPTRLDDAGLYMAFGQSVEVFNKQTGPLTKATLEEMRQDLARFRQPEVGGI